MRILICNFEYPPLGGGGGIFSALLAEEMAKRHKVTVLTSQGLGLPGESVENGLRIVRVPVYFRRKEAVANLLSMLSFIPIGIRAGKALLKTEKYDVINTHFVLPTGPVGDALSGLGGIPNVLTLHGGDLYEPTKFTSPHRHPILRIWIRRLLGRADLVVGDSENNLDNMRRYYTPHIKGVRIPLGIQRPSTAPVSRKHYGFGEDEVLLVTVGRLVRRKAINQMISIVESFKNGKVHLLIVGSGPEEKVLKVESQKRQLEKQIHFTGHVEEDEKFKILQMSDLYVSTSQHEGFGLVFLEAMASGLPIVCYDYGGQTDFLRDGETGYLVPLNDLSLFRERCEMLISDSESREQMRQHNKTLAEEFYISKSALRYENALLSVLMQGNE